MKTVKNRYVSAPSVKYPYLMESLVGTLVLMTASGVGTVLYTAGSNPVGDHRTDWVMSNFKAFGGEVTLSN